MKKKELENYKNLLLKMKANILNGGILRSQEGLTIASEDLAEDGDIANSVINQEISFNMKQRELIKLRNIEEALQRIENGTFGVCEECDEPIKAKRLENQPWTTLCIVHAEDKERENNKFSRVA
ncbi:MAG: TraR/DksA family transcriptional regulator [Bdellovibrionales bacterium]|jgi:DnaK suppressor protein|nr:TraR/DksA family transcriptional regulator [Bdellovibrionales bacterium]